MKLNLKGLSGHFRQGIILEQHKEKINVTSEDGVTTFSFSLATE